MASWSVFDDEPTPEPYPEDTVIQPGQMVWVDDKPIGIATNTGILTVQKGDTISWSVVLPLILTYSLFRMVTRSRGRRR